MSFRFIISVFIVTQIAQMTQSFYVTQIALIAQILFYHDFTSSVDINPLGIRLCVQLYAIDSVPCGVSLICAICDICVTYNCLCALLVKVQVELTDMGGGVEFKVRTEGTEVRYIVA